MSEQLNSPAIPAGARGQNVPQAGGQIVLHDPIDTRGQNVPQAGGQIVLHDPIDTRGQNVPQAGGQIVLHDPTDHEHASWIAFCMADMDAVVWAKLHIVCQRGHAETLVLWDLLRCRRETVPQFGVAVALNDYDRYPAHWYFSQSSKQMIPWRDKRAINRAQHWLAAKGFVELDPGSFHKDGVRMRLRWSKLAAALDAVPATAPGLVPHPAVLCKLP